MKPSLFEDLTIPSLHVRYTSPWVSVTEQISTTSGKRPSHSRLLKVAHEVVSAAIHHMASVSHPIVWGGLYPSPIFSTSSSTTGAWRRMPG